jgi:hypothetical protein
MQKEKPHGYISPAYCFLVPLIQQIARPVGYAIAVHGSMNNDLDLIAIPWIPEAKSAQELLSTILNACSVFYRRDENGDFVDDDGFKTLDPGELSIKPHGRLSWSIQLSYGGRIDLSVMPTLKGELT